MCVLQALSAGLTRYYNAGELEIKLKIETSLKMLGSWGVGIDYSENLIVSEDQAFGDRWYDIVNGVLVQVTPPLNPLLTPSHPPTDHLRTPACHNDNYPPHPTRTQGACRLCHPPLSSPCHLCHPPLSAPCPLCRP
eukprot:1183123-Prorocentrum_minimum.AAC.5